MIPQTIIQYWHDLSTLPDSLQGCMDTTRRSHPGYRFILADDAYMEKFIRQHYGRSWLRLFQLNRIPASRSDMARLLLLQQQGGLYIDLSMSCHRPLEATQLAADALLVQRDDSPVYAACPEQANVMNGILGFPPESPFSAWCLKRMEQNLIHGHYNYQVALATGPAIINQALHRFKKRLKINILKFSRMKQQQLEYHRAPGISNTWICAQSSGIIDPQPLRCRKQRIREKFFSGQPPVYLFLSLPVFTPMTHKARKRFGQNFLHDPGAIHNIIDAIGPRATDHLVEIGPGQGAITEQLLPESGRLDAIELDRDLINLLQRRFASHPHFYLHNKDALKFDFCTLAKKSHRLRIVGNLPYNISTPLLFHLLEQPACIQDMHFMLQKEVVERMAAAPGNKTYGRLSVMLQIHCRVQHLFNIGPGAFHPAPKVESAFVRLHPFQQPPFIIEDKALLARIVTQAFSQRRKTLRNTLRGLVSAEQMESCAIDPGARAEQLSPGDFVCLSNANLNLTPVIGK